MNAAREQSVVDAGAPVTALWPGDAGGLIVTRARNSLRYAHIYTISALTERTADDLMDLREFGPGQLAEVRRALRAAGLALKGDPLS